MGVHYRKLDIPGADRLTGRGIYYGAALVEALACKDEDVFMVGGANSAGQAALHFARYARKVTMLVRGNGLSATMSKYLIDEIERTSNIVLEAQTQVVEAIGEVAGSKRGVSRAGYVAFRIYRGSAGLRVAAALHPPG
jgi:thioredoxin reductase (NADPH)